MNKCDKCKKPFAIGDLIKVVILREFRENNEPFTIETMVKDSINFVVHSRCLSYS